MRERALLPAPRPLLGWLVATTMLLTAIGFAVQWWRDFDPHTQLPLLLQAFDVNREANVPTWFSAFVLLVVALLARSIAVAERSRSGEFWPRWHALAWIALLLSLDEIAALHELSVKPIRAALDVGGIFYFAWVIPGLLLTALAAAAYWRFVQALPAHSRGPFVAGATLFVAGALGMEMAGGWYRDGGSWDETYVVLFTLEEGLEMLGGSLLAYSLALYLERDLKAPALQVL